METDLTIPQRMAIAERVVAAVTKHGMRARAWTGDRCVRIYVARTLSRRTQDMGHISIEMDGHRNYNGLERARAGVRDAVEAALAG